MWSFTSSLLVRIRLVVLRHRNKFCTQRSLWSHISYLSSKSETVRYVATTPEYNFGLTAGERYPDTTVSIKKNPSTPFDCYYYYYWYSPLGPVWAETRVRQATGMALVRCIMGKFLGVACHCFPPLFRRSHFSPPGASTSATT